MNFRDCLRVIPPRTLHFECYTMTSHANLDSLNRVIYYVSSVVIIARRVDELLDLKPVSAVPESPATPSPASP